MVWSKWKASAVFAGFGCASLTFAGLVFSAQTTPRPSAAETKSTETITITEAGKPPQQCVIQKTTRQPNGQVAHEIRNVSTGEVTTIYMDGNGPAMGKAPAGMLPWSKDKAGATSPAASQEPGNWAPTTSASSNPSFTSTAQRMPVGPSAAEFRTIDEPGKPGMKCRIIAEWRTPEGNQASQLQAVDSGEFMTIVEVTGNSPGGLNENGKVTARLYRWGASKTSPTGAPVPPVAVAANPPSTSGQSFPTPNKIVMAPSKAIAMPMAESPLVFDKLQAANTDAKSVEPMKMADVSHEAAAPTLGDTTKIVAAPKPLELPRAPDALKLESLKSSTAMNVNDARKALGLPKLPDPTKSDAMKPLETAKTANSIDASKALDLPKLSEAPKVATAMPPLPPMTLLPGSPSASADSTKQISPNKMPGVGKPSQDTTLPAVPGQLTGINGLPSLPAGGAAPGAMSAASRKSDPLANPEAFLPPRIDKETGKTPAIGIAQAGDAPRLPLGASSVSAAANGFLPDPRMMAPQAGASMAPMAPFGQMPSLPTVPQGGNSPMFVNAFTPPQTPESQQQAAAMAQMQQMQQMQMMQQMQQRQMMPMTQPGYPMPQGYPPMMPQGYGPMPGQMPMGYPGPMPPNPVANMQGYPMMPQGNPMMPQGYPMMPQSPMRPMQPATGYSNPAMDRPGMPVGGGTTMQQSLNILQSSIFPTQRELAVIQLSACDWRANPQVVNLLLTTAKEDPAAMVRAACVSGLTRMGVASDIAVATYTQLKTDSDPRVRQEAEQALARTPSTTGIQPASAVNR